MYLERIGDEDKVGGLFDEEGNSVNYLIYYRNVFVSIPNI